MFPSPSRLIPFPLGNAWDRTQVPPGGVSRLVDVGDRPLVYAEGNSDAATVLTLLAGDGTGAWVELCRLTLHGPGDFRIDTTSGWRYLQLRSSAAAKITATIAAMPLRGTMGMAGLRHVLGQQAVTTPWGVGRMLPPA